MSQTTQPTIPGLDDTRFKREKRSRSRTQRAIDRRDAEPIPVHACHSCGHWRRVGATPMGECERLRVQTKYSQGVEAGTIMERPDDETVLYGPTFEPLRTHESFRACSGYEARGTTLTVLKGGKA